MDQLVLSKLVLDAAIKLEARAAAIAVGPKHLSPRCRSRSAARRSEISAAVSRPVRATPHRSTQRHLADRNPGDRKNTHCARAAESGINFISVKGPELLSKWVGDSERGIRDVFRKARQAAQCILFFDEIDTITPIRGQSDGGGQVSERMVGQFLLEMDNLAQARGVVVLAASNRPELIDPALMRPGRFKLQIELPLPSEDARKAIFDIHLNNRPLAEDISADQLARRSAGMNGAHIASVCRRAAMLAIRDSITEHPGTGMPPIMIRPDHVEAAMIAVQAALPGGDRV